MKTLSVVLAVLLANFSGNVLLESLNDFQKREGVNLLKSNLELMQDFGTSEYAFIDGRIGREMVAAKLLTGDQTAALSVKQVCKTPTPEIRNTCQIFMDFI